MAKRITFHLKACGDGYRASITDDLPCDASSDTPAKNLVIPVS